jgi:hypothetical protein
MQPQRSDDIDALDRATSAFLSVRSLLFGIAYRMLSPSPMVVESPERHVFLFSDVSA